MMLCIRSVLYHIDYINGFHLNLVHKSVLGINKNGKLIAQIGKPLKSVVANFKCLIPWKFASITSAICLIVLIVFVSYWLMKL